MDGCSFPETPYSPVAAVTVAVFRWPLRAVFRWPIRAAFLQVFLRSGLPSVSPAPSDHVFPSYLPRAKRRCHSKLSAPRKATMSFQTISPAPNDDVIPNPPLSQAGEEPASALPDPGFCKVGPSLKESRRYPQDRRCSIPFPFVAPPGILHSQSPPLAAPQNETTPPPPPGRPATAQI